MTQHRDDPVLLRAARLDGIHLLEALPRALAGVRTPAGQSLSAGYHQHVRSRRIAASTQAAPDQQGPGLPLAAIAHLAPEPRPIAGLALAVFRRVSWATGNVCTEIV